MTTSDMSLELLLGHQLEAYRAAGFVVTGISSPGPWAPALARRGINHLPVPWLRRSWAPLDDARALVTLVRVFHEERFDIVHTHTPKAGVLGRLAARLAGVPVIVNTVHGFYAGEGTWRRRLLVWAERLAARCSDFELCQSREDLETLREMGVISPERSAYLGNGIDLQMFDPVAVNRSKVRERLGIARDAVVTGTVGRLVWEKGYREFFAMAQRLAERKPAPVVLAVGPMETAKVDAVPASLVDDLSRRGVVRFLGLRTDMPELYAAMDVFVLASYREGFPRSAIEAAAMGLPLVLTDIRGCREVVRDGCNGFLVPPGDAGALTSRVEQLVGDPALRARFGQESRRRAEAEFDERRVIETTLTVYQRLLREKSGARVGAHQAGRTT